MIDRFLNHINTHFPYLGSKRLLLAVSGGLDSVVLTHLCYQLKLNVALAHCNFNLRSDESDADEDFVLQLAEDLDLEVFIESFDTTSYAQKHKMSIQMAARELRYHWFEELSEQLKFDYILTAHHADDNLETFLIHLIRGTGLDGLTGIPEINNTIIRPLLPFSRADLQEFAKSNNLDWREDSSNASTKYLRNKLRHEVIPVLKDINPGLLKNFQSTSNHLKDAADLISDRVDYFFSQAVEKTVDNQLRLRISEFKKQNNPRAYLYAILKDYGFTEWQDVTDLLDAQSGKQVFSSTHRLLKDRDYLLLTANTNESHQTFKIEPHTAIVELPTGNLVLSEVNGLDEINNKTLYIDKDRLKYPLLIRKWQEGDYFYPLGMTGKKKLSKYLKDEKLSLIDKEKIWLLTSGKDIVWIIGKRADDRFKVTDTTRTILKIALQ